MVDGTYKISAQAKLGWDTERLMYMYTEMLNQGRDVSGLQNVMWVQNLVLSQTHGQMSLSDTVWPSFNDIVQAVSRGHISIGGFDDYVNLRTSSGQNPYTWNDRHGLGHVLLIVGYDNINQWIAVHDPLQAITQQPKWYSWSGFQAAGFHDLLEVTGPAVSTTTGILSGGGGQMVLPTTSALIDFIIAFLVAILKYIATIITPTRP